MKPRMNCKKLWNSWRTHEDSKNLVQSFPKVFPDELCLTDRCLAGWWAWHWKNPVSSGNCWRSKSPVSLLFWILVRWAIGGCWSAPYSEVIWYCDLGVPLIWFFRGCKETGTLYYFYWWGGFYWWKEEDLELFRKSWELIKSITDWDGWVGLCSLLLINEVLNNLRVWLSLQQQIFESPLILPSSDLEGNLARLSS